MCCIDTVETFQKSDHDELLTELILSLNDWYTPDSLWPVTVVQLVGKKLQKKNEQDFNG